MPQLRELLMTLFGLSFAQVLCAAPADDIKALLDKGDAAAAYELAKKHPDELGNPAFDFYFGVAAIDSGRAGEGVLALERYLVNFPGNNQARLELARGYFILGEYARAREEFGEVLKTDPPPAVQANIERYLDAIRSRESAYRTTAAAFIEFGLGYDSNINGGVSDAVISLPNFANPVTVAAGGVKIKSSFAQLAGGVNVVHPVSPGVAMFGSMSGDAKTHDVHNEFDQRNLGIAAGASLLSDKNLFRAALSFNTLEVDYSRFRDVAGVTAEWSHQLDELRAVNAFAQYAALDYAGANGSRDARLHGIGGGFRRAFVGSGRPLLALSGSYSREDNRRNRDELGRDIWSLRAGVSLTPAPKWAVNLGASFQHSKYAAPAPFFAVTRRDDYYGLDASVSYALTRSLSLRGELLASRNESNIALFEYRREVAALKLRYDFK
jgi:tetratricopeptide (TPR) repeat protein